MGPWTVMPQTCRHMILHLVHVALLSMVLSDVQYVRVRTIGCANYKRCNLHMFLSFLLHVESFRLSNAWSILIMYEGSNTQRTGTTEDWEPGTEPLLGQVGTALERFGGVDTSGIAFTCVQECLEYDIFLLAAADVQKMHNKLILWWYYITNISKLHMQLYCHILYVYMIMIMII